MKNLEDKILFKLGSERMLALSVVILYAFLTAFGILGIGNFVWTLLKHPTDALPIQNPSINFKENGFLSLAISWLLGYFAYEGVLSLLSTCGLFQPPVVTIVGGILTLSGYVWIFKKKGTFQNSLKETFSPLGEVTLLLALACFLLFWNLYPAFDVDSLAFYFTAIKQFLENGGKTFSPFSDIRYTVPLGENYLYALGFALKPNSTIFPQIIHGISKVMFLFGVYGAARFLGLGFFALIPAALIVSEEHFIASGTNIFVRLNIPLTFSIFGIFFGLFAFSSTKSKKYLALALIAGFQAMACKYLGVAYFAVMSLLIMLGVFLNKDLRRAAGFSYKREPKTLWILTIAAVFGTLPYLHNWFLTGTPFFPASFGPWHSIHYDPTVSELARNWHYHLGFQEALKHVTAFMVWPGILSSKILLPLALGAGLLASVVSKDEQRLFTQGLWFFLISLIIILLSETYIVFEMRYYRYGLGIYSLSCVLLTIFMFRTLFKRLPILERGEALFRIGLVLLISLYCVRHSFNVMGESRASANDILQFLTFKKSEPEIIADRYPESYAKYKNFEEAALDPQQLGFFLSFSWPHTYYPIAGKNIAFLNSAAFPSEVYFNEGLFAQSLLKENITYIYNETVNNQDYPLPGGAVYLVLNQCGESQGNSGILELSVECLRTLATQKNLEDAKERMQQALSRLRSHPPYEPFNPPAYGGPSGVIK